MTAMEITPSLDDAAVATGLDVVLELRPGVSAVAHRNVPSTSTIFATHFPRFPVLPGVLIIDDLARLAALVFATDGDVERWQLATVSRARFRRFVRPGDVAELSVEVLPDTGQPCVRGVVRVDGKPVTTVGALVMKNVAATGNQEGRPT